MSDDEMRSELPEEQTEAGDAEEYVDGTVLPDQEEEAQEPEEPKEPVLTPESVQTEIRRTRHDKEILLYGACIVVGSISAIYTMVTSLQGDSLFDELRKIIMDSNTGDPGAAQAAVWLLLTIASFVLGIGAIIALLVFIVISVYRLYGQEMAYSIRVSETNFPEIYAKVKEYSWLLGIKEPEVYVAQMNGELNAFTSWVPGKTYIQLNAEIVDVAYLEHKDLDTVLFVMAHEFGHVYLHHVQLKYLFWSILVNFAPFLGQIVLGPLLSRSREYSADRVGQALTAGKAERDCMMLLGVGRHVYKYMDAEKYLQEITSNHNKAERLARWVTNFMASHPIMPYRTEAIMDPQKKSGRLL